LRGDGQCFVMGGHREIDTKRVPPGDDGAGAGPETFMKRLFTLGAAILWLTGLGGCSPEQKELRRQVSPNQKLIAVLMESGGAAGTIHEDLYVNDHGQPLNLDNPVFSAVGCDPLSFEWVNDYTLQIHYETTCAISHFTNRWSRPSDVAVGKPNPIEIVLVRGG
jgi:hypothetical protein